MAPKTTVSRPKRNSVTKKKVPVAKTPVNKPTRQPANQAEIIAKLKKEIMELKKKSTDLGQELQDVKRELSIEKDRVTIIREEEMAIRRMMQDQYRDSIRGLERRDRETNIAAQTEKNEHEKTKKAKLLLEAEVFRNRSEISILKGCINYSTTLKLVNEEKKKVTKFRRETLSAQKELRECQEGKESTLKPWRQCEICSEEYTETAKHCPRILGCGHTLCSTCIKSLAEADGIQCPFDRLITLVKKTKLSTLPKNFIVLHM